MKASDLLPPSGGGSQIDKYRVIRPISSKMTGNVMQFESDSLVIQDTGQLHMIVAIGAATGDAQAIMKLQFEDDTELKEYTSIAGFQSMTYASSGDYCWSEMLRGHVFKSLTLQMGSASLGYVVFADVEKVL